PCTSPLLTIRSRPSSARVAPKRLTKPQTQIAAPASPSRAGGNDTRGSACELWCSPLVSSSVRTTNLPSEATASVAQLLHRGIVDGADPALWLTRRRESAPQDRSLEPPSSAARRLRGFR